MELIGTREVEERFGITRIQVFRLMASGDWPEVVETHTRVKVWNAEDVEAKIAELKEHGRITADGRLVPWRFLDRPRAAT